MEAGRWNEAATALVDALHNAKGNAVPREAQYLAAVRLCKVRTMWYIPVLVFGCNPTVCHAGMFAASRACQ